MPSFVDHRRTRPDPAAYADLFETTGWNGTYRCTADELDASLRASWIVETAWEDGNLVGSGRLVSDGVLYATVFDLIVRPSHQGRGIGSGILSRLLARCVEAGIRDVLLFAADGTAPFYERHGFMRRPEAGPGMMRRRATGS